MTTRERWFRTAAEAEARWLAHCEATDPASVEMLANNQPFDYSEVNIQYRATLGDPLPRQPLAAETERMRRRFRRYGAGSSSRRRRHL